MDRIKEEIDWMMSDGEVGMDGITMKEENEFVSTMCEVKTEGSHTLVELAMGVECSLFNVSEVGEEDSKVNQEERETQPTMMETKTEIVTFIPSNRKRSGEDLNKSAKRSRRNDIEVDTNSSKACGETSHEDRDSTYFDEHPSSTREFVCKTSGKSYLKSSNLAVDKISHIAQDDSKRKKFECDICDKIFVSRVGLTIHKRCHLDDEEARKPFKCEECGMRFPTSSGLKRHAATHLSENDHLKMKFECDICGKHLSSNQAWNRHKETHLDLNDPEQAEMKRKFKCEKCGKSYTAASNLKIHMQTHTGNTDDDAKKPFKCEECGRRFAQSGHLSGHKSTHLPVDDPSKKKFDCDICGKSFKWTGDLNRHKRSHFDEFPCEVCGHTFTILKSLEQHMKKHTKFPLACAICTTGFKSEDGLAKHMSIYHKDIKQ